MNWTQAMNILGLIAVAKSVPKWQRDAEQRLARRMQSVFERAAKAAIAELRRRGVPAEAIARQTVMSQIVDADERLLEIAMDGAEEAAREGAKRAANQARAKGVSVPAERTTLADGIAKAIREKTFVASQGTLARLRGDVMETLSKAYEEGLGIDEAARMLRDKFDSMRDFELQRVARTEIHGAQSDGAHAILENIGVEYEQWITAMDGRERESHAEIDGQITRVADRFSNGLRYPGDRDGPIEEWVNCRCREVPFIMPKGALAPPGKDWFFEGEIIHN